MTRDQFIEDYMATTGLPLPWKIKGGVKVPGVGRRMAVACLCGEATCPGWKMLTETDDISAAPVSKG
ncbi:MAG: hypothetical protein AB7O88_02690 [Reyranellaceae bacterium]